VNARKAVAFLKKSSAKTFVRGLGFGLKQQGAEVFCGAFLQKSDRLILN